MRLAASGDPDRVLLWQDGRAITQGMVFAEARSLAQALPDRRHVLNLCDGRHAFLVGLLAAVLREQVVLLPNDRSQRFAELLQRDLPDLYALVDDGRTDHPTDTLDVATKLGGQEAVKQEAVKQEAVKREATKEVPLTSSQRDALMVFTSGSTGQPQPHYKPLIMLHFVARALVERFKLDALGGGTIVATVPSQHMYGLETTIALPLWSGLGVHAGRPFYPTDIAMALEQVPGPRILVTTPVHMRTLLASEVSLPPLHMVISATAPLSQEAARRFEDRFGTEVYEIFGFSEAGTVATRRTAEEPSWLACDGLTFRGEGSSCAVHGAHFREPIPLNDLIELLAPNRFELRGRSSDNVNIAGKRTSLSGLNTILTAIEGVVDGAFYLQEESEDERTARLIAIVVAPESSPDAIRRELRRSIDPVFVPRRIYLVPSLPRSENGKLTQAALSDLAGRLTKGRA